MTKIIVEILVKQRSEIEAYKVDESRTITIDTKIDDSAKQRARTKLEELKANLSPNEKIRVIEYHNDDADENRKPCKILYEG